MRCQRGSAWGKERETESPPPKTAGRLAGHAVGARLWAGEPQPLSRSHLARTAARDSVARGHGLRPWVLERSFRHDPANLPTVFRGADFIARSSPTRHHAGWVWGDMPSTSISERLVPSH